MAPLYPSAGQAHSHRLALAAIARLSPPQSASCPICSASAVALVACLRLRPNSMLITQKPNIPEVFRGTSQKGDCPGICPGSLPRAHPDIAQRPSNVGAHPQTQPLSNSGTVLLATICTGYAPTTYSLTRARARRSQKFTTFARWAC